MAYEPSVLLVEFFFLIPAAGAPAPVAATDGLLETEDLAWIEDFGAILPAPVDALG